MLSDNVDVWLIRPWRKNLGDGMIVWVATREDGSSAHHGAWTIEQARIEARSGAPDDDRQCTRIGPG